MKDGIIRLTHEPNIVYDSIEKVYRYRMHCPYCGKVVPPCKCYADLDILLIEIDDGIADYTCSSKCALLVNEGEWDNLDDAMNELGLQKNLKECISKIPDGDLKEWVESYNVYSIITKLSECTSDIPAAHLKNPNRKEQEEILLAMGDAKDLLWNSNIPYYPEISELTEEQARDVLNLLYEYGDFEQPSGEDCII